MVNQAATGVRRRFVREYLRTLTDRRSRIATKHLIFHYLLRFEPGVGDIEVIGSHLANAVTNWEWDWKRRHGQYGIFDASRGPRDVAEQALEHAQPRTVLKDVGLSGPLAASGYALACFREAACQVQERLPRRLERDLVRRLAELIGEGPDGRFEMPQARRYFADAVLVPWQSSDPPEDLRDYIRANAAEVPERSPCEARRVERGQHTRQSGYVSVVGAGLIGPIFGGRGSDSARSPMGTSAGILERLH
jgi:hypothetical protein